jgi:hypothetical protein
LIVFKGKGQPVYQIGTMPVININKGLKNDWSLNLKWESRQRICLNDLNSGTYKGFEYVLSDISLIVTKKIGFNNRIAGGYEIRLIKNRVLHELIQQYIIVRAYNRFLTAHRFSAHQIFGIEETPEFEFRYRISAAIPLNGETIDPKEFYFKANNEYLYFIEGQVLDFEIRLGPLLGYEFTDNNKLEFGIDYRLSSVLKETIANRFWIVLKWYVKI